MIRDVSRWPVAWLIACTVFCLHIIDEGLHGSFGFYSDLERLLTILAPSLNITPFNFDVWLVNMTGTLLALFLLTPLTARGHRLMVPASFAFATFLSGNAALHMLMAFGRGEIVTGSLTAPFMLAAGLFLFLSTGKAAPQRTTDDA
jgi:hypothetical protein